MKLRNKKTGEIIATSDYTFATYDDGIKYGRHTYSSLAELNEDWEDYEEQSEFYIVGHRGWIDSRYKTNDKYEEPFKEIGNYFETEKEAKKAVEKLKALKRLKDCGFKFVGWERDKQYSGDYHIEAEDYDKCDDKDLDLIFGGKE